VISLDISAAFDTINHVKLLSRFRDEFGVTDMAFNWLKSYIEDRYQFVKLGRHSSATVRCISGVPQDHRALFLGHWFLPRRLRVTDWRGYQQLRCGPSSVCRWYSALPSNVYLNHSFQFVHTRNMFSSRQTLVRRQWLVAECRQVWGDACRIIITVEGSIECQYRISRWRQSTRVIGDQVARRGHRQQIDIRHPRQSYLQSV
jgi:hypothetical protein